MLPAPLTLTAARLLARVRRRLLAHRRVLAALLTAAAVAAGLRAVAPPAPERVAMTVAARDLPAGATVTAADVATADVDPGTVPDGAVRTAVGSVLAGPLRRGEPVTDARLVGPSLTLAHPDLVALPVRLPDGAMAGLLAAGDRIDLYAVRAEDDHASGGATRVGTGVLVLAVPPEKEGSNSVTPGLGGRLIVVGVPQDAVARVADASVRSFLTVAFVH